MPSVPAEAYEPDRIEAIEIEALVHAIHARWGYDFRGYAAASFRRRVLRAVEHEAGRKVDYVIKGRRQGDCAFSVGVYGVGG